MQTISIRLIQEDDIHIIHELANNNLVSMTSSVPFPCPRSVIEEWYAENSRENPSMLSFAITNSNKIVGVCTLKRIDYYQRTAEISYWINPHFWGQGIGKYSALQLRDFAFGNLNMYCLYAHFLKFSNQPSKKILESIGFIPDNIIKDIPVEGRFAESFPEDYWTFYKLTRDSWLGMKALTAPSE